ncbi:unnamed protein product [Gadus morhua 'NCC']
MIPSQLHRSGDNRNAATDTLNEDWTRQAAGALHWLATASITLLFRGVVDFVTTQRSLKEARWSAVYRAHRRASPCRTTSSKRRSRYPVLLYHENTVGERNTEHLLFEMEKD